MVIKHLYSDSHPDVVKAAIVLERGAIVDKPVIRLGLQLARLLNFRSPRSGVSCSELYPFRARR